MEGSASSAAGDRELREGAVSDRDLLEESRQKHASLQRPAAGLS